MAADSATLRAAEAAVATGAGSRNLDESALRARALADREAVEVPGGALAVRTGMHTGRSPRDKFIVRDPAHAGQIDWGRNAPMEPAHFGQLRADLLATLGAGNSYSQDLFACADPDHRLRVRVITRFAWHALFIRHLLRRPAAGARSSAPPDFTVIDVPDFRADPARHGCRSETVIALSFAERLALIGGTAYAGEMKKSVFTVLNCLLPARGVMPMHCAANHAPDDPSRSAVFFGLSGTGKTTLSATSERTLLGDDEHGWAEGRLFNFEGGCYAKSYRLSADTEPEIHAAAFRTGSVMENVFLDPETRMPDFGDGSITENGRVAYPLEAISNASAAGIAGEPAAVVMLACDAFGVLPPIARLNHDQAVYHFLSGFTAKVAGTERGLAEPVPTFSTCFGAPFMPRPPAEYGRLFRESLGRRKPRCWLVNTGWSGGGVGVGSRMPVATTRDLVSAALSGALDGVAVRTDPRFGFEVPAAAPVEDPGLLDARSCWADKDAYDAAADKLAAMFQENFVPFAPAVDATVRAAGPVSG